MLAFIEHGELHQDISKVNSDGPSPHTYCGKGLVAICRVGSNIICHYTFKLTNNAQEQRPYRFGFKSAKREHDKFFFFLCQYLNPDLKDEQQMH